ncbi:hypothetical protein LOTGIDRAFT_97270, partial [Lottia gigantea]
IFILFLFFDVYYFLRGLIVSVYSRFKSRISILEESVVPGICLTTDLDFNLHMNNGRYLREGDFGRFDFWVRSRYWQEVKKLGGSLTNGGNNIRYRKSLVFLDRYNIHTKVVYWDERSFYMEQKLIRTQDQFICSIALIKQVVLGATPADLVSKLDPNIVCPDPPKELLLWLEAAQISSEKLRKS